MKALLDNRFAPITFTLGFVESPFAEFSKTFIQWQSELDAKSGCPSENRNFCASLAEALQTLEPLTTPSNRYLLIETRSRWSAIFANGLRVNDVFSPVSYLPEIPRCRGLHINCIPDRTSRGKDCLQPYGAVSFALYGPRKTNWLNRIRTVSISNDVSGWEFSAEREIQPYEQTENYKKRKIVERFTPEMLENYCRALGIELFEDKFYGGACLLSHRIFRTIQPSPSMTIAEARSHLYLA